MKLAEERHIAADPATVWAAVLNPQVLQACVPGCESLTGSPSEGFEAIVVQKVGPVKARFTGTVTLSEMVEAQSLRITGEGKGGVAGFAKNLAEEFFNRFQSAIEGPDQEAPAEAEDAPADEGTEDKPKKGWFRRLIG